VPAIAAAIVRGQDDEATKISEDSMRIATVLSMPMGVGLAVLCGPIMQVLYPGSHEAGPTLLLTMGIASFFVCLVLMENAILQATGKEQYPMYSMIVGSFVKIAINYFLVADPRINIYGAPVGTLASYAVMCIMNFIFMCRVLDKNPRLRAILIRPALCSGAMGVSAWAIYGLVLRFMGTGRVAMLLAMVAAMGVAVVIYLLMTVLLGTVTKEDMKLIPGGEKLARLLHLH